MDDRHRVLRLLRGEGPGPPDGHVAYLADTETVTPRRSAPVAVEITSGEHRVPYAELEDPRCSTEWARQATGHPITIRQQRTWSLSATWRPVEADGRPVASSEEGFRFSAHGPVAVEEVPKVAPGLAPPLMAVGEGGRMLLLGHGPGADCYGAGVGLREAVAATSHAVQAHLANTLAPGTSPQDGEASPSSRSRTSVR